MGLTYDGITYRSLEEQVRYDAEQVQLLKQADVTINENLQTVNTEIDGKLTKPTNPSAESAVTMLADGTVGTKPLSEIGGGGKLYLHKITAYFGEEPFYIIINIINTSFTKITENVYIQSHVVEGTIGYYNGSSGVGPISIRFVEGSNNYEIMGVVVDYENTGHYLNKRVPMSRFNDTVIEL